MQPGGQSFLRLAMKTPLQVFKAWEWLHRQDKWPRDAPIRMQVKYGLEPDEELLEYWRVNGYTELDKSSFHKRGSKSKLPEESDEFQF